MIGSQTTGRQTIAAWWNEHLDYRWLIRTLDHHGALRVMKGVVAVGGAVIALITALALVSTAGPTGVWNLVTVFTITFGVAWAAYWALAPWPGERASLILMACADVAITVGCLAESNRLFSALGLMQLVIPGGYLLAT
ncbi:hypothetical protein [Nocardia stercoris]|uniref:GGDEF domain-containing protein n=1 Tax=Nocardia stercoris TaxID=2483361 RepID=A0A3M2L5Q1_9NOCA|nr:hypothetical protein [Nocardia stercoris]RMI32887.1 hypothetical protein EBN03_13290 [Nocardia stercoris]